MQTLIILLRKYAFFLLFLLFEVLSLYIYLSHFQEKKADFLNTTSVVTGGIYEQYHELEQYLYLRHQNESLVDANNRLRNQLHGGHAYSAQTIEDDTTRRQFTYYPARVINNTVNKNHNYITLNKGTKDSINPEMGVIGPNGIVGIVRDVSPNYSLVISLLNIRLGISAKIRESDYFGSVKWDGQDASLTKLNEIPNYTEIAMGDTVITSGYSAIFPEGLPIGQVKNFKKDENSNFYNITVELFTDFRKQDHVQVIKNYLRKERRNIEDIYQEE